LAEPSGAAQMLRTQSPLQVAASESSGILFVSTRDGSAEIYRMNEVGTDQVRLTSSGHDNSAPAWSPDGRQIAFLSRVAGGAGGTTPVELQLVDSEGIGSVELTAHFEGSVESLAWSPDGRRIAFVGNPTPGGDSFDGTNVFVIDTDGSGLTQVTQMEAGTVGCWYPIWSPASSQLAYICRSLMQAAIGFETVGAGDSFSFDYFGQIDQLFWLPSGDHIGFGFGMCSVGAFPAALLLTQGASDDGPYPCLDQDFEALGVILRGLYDFKLAWSPAADSVFALQSVMGIEVVDLSRYSALHIQFESDALHGPPSWSPDGTRIAFAADGGLDSEIYVLDLASGAVTQLTDNQAEDTMPDWGP
jgi:Tol biopolymer transport system component